MKASLAYSRHQANVAETRNGYLTARSQVHVKSWEPPHGVSTTLLWVWSGFQRFTLRASAVTYMTVSTFVSPISTP